ncbi:uncharacterized protein LOC115760357 [Drosophila novamexicana]|uniref:uncharacterized protein LOC115760357 n=1 Tax=Drosophila novamexicana TaxID=47314 RepID=UPI0011E5D0C3|nr:uncharacterized protein LOC115760357 [Drosophila novamexicana]
MARRSIIFIVMWVHFSCTLPKKITKCDDNTTETASGRAYWKFRGIRYTTSEDILCWKDHWELFLRECNTTTGQWLPENVVCKPEEKINKYCPEDLNEIYDDKGSNSVTDTTCCKKGHNWAEGQIKHLHRSVMHSDCYTKEKSRP